MKERHSLCGSILADVQLFGMIYGVTAGRAFEATRGSLPLHRCGSPGSAPVFGGAFAGSGSPSQLQPRANTAGVPSQAEGHRCNLSQSYFGGKDR
ncbi:hypothetical protein AAFF_G00292700 [Aldrovandia affinis]|uniref:Uncharacterized protein n=1 Tax=Aldrovandia affinis TaxID=143900 RepID=A0AAD7WSR4_9TELE|nr:hypothetical protein AAFF_G00292700 [Aldrovandia affinis]